MQMTEAEYRQLKAQIDSDAKAETQAAADRIEHERVQNHQALDRVWAMIRRAATTTAPQTAPTLFTPAATNGNGHGEEQPRAPFAMKATIQDFIDTAHPPRITQPLIYEHLCDLYWDSISHRDQQQVRGQITNILTKLSEGDEAILEVVQEATGNSPKIFRVRR